MQLNYILKRQHTDPRRSWTWAYWGLRAGFVSGSHPDELLQPSVPTQNLFVQFHSFRMSTAELWVQFLHVLGWLSWKLHINTNTPSHDGHVFRALLQLLYNGKGGGGAGKVAGSGTCLSSRSPILRTVKLVSLPSWRPSFLRLSSSDRKLECHSISWSRQGKTVWTTPASSITSSCIPRRYTPSMILNVRTWWNSVWSNSERQRRDKKHCETNIRRHL